MTLAEFLIGAFGTLLTAGLITWIGWSLKTLLRISVAEPIARVEACQAEHGEAIDFIRKITHHHLGDNGDTPQMWRELIAVKDDVAEIKTQQMDRS